MKANKNKATKQKDPKKVAAGLARARSAVRINGKFVTNFFKEELKKDAAAVGHSGDLQTFLSQNEIVYENLYETGSLRSATLKADTTVFKEAAKFEGKLIVRQGGEDVSVTIHELKYKILQVEQALMSNESCAGISFRPILTFDGRMILELPSLEEIEEMETDDDLMNMQESNEGLTIYISSKKGQKRNADKKQRKTKAIEKNLQNVRPKRTAKAKGGTKRKKR